MSLAPMIPVQLPRFAPSSGPDQPTLEAASGNAIQSGDGDLDFDLLAEYLLDDPPASVATNSNLQFDFSLDSSALNPGVVSPEQSEGEIIASQQADKAGGMTATPGSELAEFQQALHARASVHKQSAPAPAAPVPAAQSVPAAPGNFVPGPAGLPGPPSVMLAPSMSSTMSGGVLVHQHAAPSGPRQKRPRLVQPILCGGDNSMAVVQRQQQAMAMQAQAPQRGRQKSQAQVDRRRERNRILARRTRLRKKFFFESLQKEVTDLQKENLVLKDIVKSRLEKDKAKAILDDCKAGDKLPSCVAEACGEGVELDQNDFSLVRSIQSSQKCFIITDPSLQDNPIVYASGAFLELTGYAREEVLGRNCRFLQGTETSASKVEQIRKGIAMGEDVSICLINYTADGTAFWNKLFIAALRDAQNNIVNFMGVIVKVPAPEPEDPEAGKRLPGEAAPEEQNGDQASSTEGLDSEAAAVAADGTVKAIEGAVSAAVAAAFDS